MKALGCLLLTIVSLACGACRTHEPPYRVEDMTFDTRLLGTWARESPPPGDGAQRGTFRVEEREVTVKGGRLDQAVLPKGPVAPTRKETGLSAQAYLIVLPAEKPGNPEFKVAAYLLRSGTRTFVGVQIPPEQLGILSGYAAVPVHIMWLYERTDDRLTLRVPRTPIAWVPVLRPIDAIASGQPDIPPIESLRGDGIPFTQNIDRLLRIYTAYADDSSFWEAPTVFRRVGE